jgi:hypothetical protein
MYSRSTHRDNGMLAKKNVIKSLKIMSQVNENTHPRSDTAQHLIDGHQLMDIDTIESVCSRDDNSTQESMMFHKSKLATEALPDI